MGHYKANLRDIEFNLFEVFGGTETFGSADFPDVDVETARDVLAQTERLAVTELAESFTEADRNPPIFDPASGTAPLPEAFKRSYKAYMDTEFWRLGLPEGLGGTVAPACRCVSTRTGPVTPSVMRCRALRAATSPGIS